MSQRVKFYVFGLKLGCVFLRPSCLAGDNGWYIALYQVSDTHDVTLELELRREVSRSEVSTQEEKVKSLRGYGSAYRENKLFGPNLKDRVT